MIGVFELLLMVLIIFLFVIPWVIALIDILKNDFHNNNKLIWLIAVIFVPFVGVIAYFLIGRKQKLIKE